jgi:hypothetical protein
MDLNEALDTAMQTEKGRQLIGNMVDELRNGLSDIKPICPSCRGIDDHEGHLCFPPEPVNVPAHQPLAGKTQEDVLYWTKIIRANRAGSGVNMERVATPLELREAELFAAWLSRWKLEHPGPISSPHAQLVCDTARCIFSEGADIDTLAECVADFERRHGEEHGVN